MSRIHRVNVKMLIKSIGYEHVARKMGEKATLLRQRANGHLHWTDEYEHRVLKALEKLGVLQEVSTIVDRAKRELKRYEQKEA